MTAAPVTAPAHAPGADQAVAKAFVTARLNAAAVPGFPGEVPQTIARSYAIQSAAIAQYPDRVAGWKVGGVSPDQQATLGVHRVAGAIFAGNVWAAGDAPTPLPAIEGGFAAVEAEFIARIGADADPAKIDWTIDEAAALIDAVFIGVELAGSPLSAINDLGSAVVASDFGNNGGLVIGPELTDWRARLDDIVVGTVIDGESVGTGGATSLAGGALESVRFLLEHCARWGRPLAAGTLVSTGAVTGVHRVFAGSVSTCVFQGVGEIRCVIVPAAPHPSQG